MPARKWFFFLLLMLSVVFMTASTGCDCGDDDDDSSSDDDANDDDTSDDDTGDDDTGDDDTGDDDTGDDDTGDDDTSESPAAPFVDEGKKYLRLGAGDLARQQFLLGYDVDPDFDQVWYGLVLADTLHDGDVISIIMSYLQMVIGFNPPPEKDDVPQTGEAFIEDLVNIILQGLLFDISDELIEQVETLRAESPDVAFELDRMPLILNFEEVADFHGEFDLADAVAAEAAARMISGLAEHLTALNLDFDLSIIFGLMDLDWGGMSFEEIVRAIVDAGLALFDNDIFPDFFTLKDDTAPFRAAGLKMGLGFANAAETYALIVAEQSSQENEVFGYVDLNGDEQWQENEPLYILPWGELDEEQNEQAWAFESLFSHLADSFLDYTEYDSDPDNAQPFHLAYVNEVLNAFGWPSLIPDVDWLIIDFGAMYRDADPTGFRDTVRTILRVLDLIVPEA